MGKFDGNIIPVTTVKDSPHALIGERPLVKFITSEMEFNAFAAGSETQVISSPFLSNEDVLGIGVFIKSSIALGTKYAVLTKVELTSSGLEITMKGEEESSSFKGRFEILGYLGGN